VQAWAAALAKDPRYRNAVTLADTDQVPVMVVLAETSVFAAAARLARLYVTNERAEEARKAQQ
jgi:hypothetical protein